MSFDIELIIEFQKLRNNGETYEGIGEKIGVSGALVWKVIKGRCTSHKARQYFGLPPKQVSIVPCSCGKVHKLKTHPNPKDRGRHRRCAEFTKERAELFDKMLALFGMSLTEWMNKELDIWLSEP